VFSGRSHILLADYCNICVLSAHFMHHSDSAYAVLESTNNDA